jgi:hypothetical protein
MLECSLTPLGTLTHPSPLIVYAQIPLSLIRQSAADRVLYVATGIKVLPVETFEKARWLLMEITEMKLLLCTNLALGHNVDQRVSSNQERPRRPLIRARCFIKGI